MKRSKEETLATRKAILREAMACFSERGYALTTFRDIAEHLGLSKGAIFWHFKTKEALLAELMLEGHKTYEPLKGLEEVTTLEGVRDVFLQWGHAIEHHTNLRRFMRFAMSRVEWSDALTRSLSKTFDGMMLTDPFDRLVAKLEELREAGKWAGVVTAQQVAVMLFSLFFGAYRSAWQHKRKLDVSATIAAGMDFVLQGLRSK